MNITIESHLCKDYLLIISRGRIDNKEELFAHSEMKAREASQYDQNKVLLDNTGIEYPKEMYLYVQLAEYYPTFIPPAVRAKKIATVIGEKYQGIGDLWETACANRGYPFRHFTSMKDALRWLQM